MNNTQSSLVDVVFKFCAANRNPLLNIKDIKKAINYATEEGKEIEGYYGKISTATTGTILRKIFELEQQGIDLIFNEMSSHTKDLMQIDENGAGYINILRLTDIQDNPKLFSTFMLRLLGKIYQQMPKKRDLNQMKLGIFIDEAHFLFHEISKNLLEQIETIVRLIHSKAISSYFITQNPLDIPNGILVQLGLKIQNTLNAFTANE